MTGSERILLVEDSGLQRRMTRRYLDREQFTVVEARTLAEARERLAEDPAVDALIIDGSLPDGDGMELVAELRADRARKDMPVFVASGHVTDEARARGIAAGATDYFPKPIDYDRLLAAVRTALRGPSVP